MALTSLDIRKTEFTRRLRGLDQDEVAAYLELLAREFESMQHEAQLRDERVRELENRLQHYERIELALEEALRTTRESSRQTVEAAHQKADQIRAEAAREAERVTAQAEHEHTRLRQEAQAIAVRRKEIVARLRAFLMSEMEVLAHFEGEDPVGYIKLMPQAEALLRSHGGEASLAQGEEERPGAPAPDAATSRVSASAAPAPDVATPEAPHDEASAPASEPMTPQIVVGEAGDVSPSHADYPTPPPVPAADTAAEMGEDRAWATPAFDYPPEVEAYFHNLAEAPTPSEPDRAAPSSWETTTAETEWAPAEPAWGFSDTPTHAAVETEPHHAPEPGESPVPSPSFEIPADAAEAWPMAPFEYEDEGFEIEPETEAPAPPDGALSADVTAAPAAPPVFDVRAIHRERYRIETFVGPSVTPPDRPAPEADVSEESDHIRRLLDRLD